jgi:multiple sugar transport system permease protein
MSQAAALPVQPAPTPRKLDSWEFWGRILVLPYLLVFLVFVLYPVGYGLWLARTRTATSSCLTTRSSFARWSTPSCSGGGHQRQDGHRAGPVGLLRAGPLVDQDLSVLFILPWAVPSIPTILSVRFMLNPEWGVINTLIFKLTGLDGPNWLNDPTLALSSRC